MFIKKLSSKQLETKYGLKDKWIITDENDRMLDAFVGNWNKDWKEGQEIDVKDSQITSREYNGKTYYSIQAPPEAKKAWGAQVDLTPIMNALRQIYELNSRILVKINNLSSLSPSMPQKSSREPQEQVKVEDINF